MTIYFSNKGHIELDTVRTMGVSVKDGDNPIGYFGTGLKFAIATLLRTGHKVTLHLDGSNIEFTTKIKIIRGKEFQMVYMEDEQLAFTTDLGKNWHVWQAYRELHSNCIDEMGKIARTPVEGSDTIWAISGAEIDQCFDNRHEIFLPTEPAWVVDGLEVHRGASKHLYYRGVRVYDLPKPSRFTLNFTMPMVLTEDRALASLYDAINKAGARLPMIADPEVCRKIIDPQWDGFEASLDYSDCWNPSEEMLDAIDAIKDNANLNRNTKNLLKNKRTVPPTKAACALSEAEEQVIQNALLPLPLLNCNLERHEFVVTEFLGENIMGLFEDGHIYVSRACVAKGTEYLSSTLYEEWVHKITGYADKSLGLQQFLFDKIFQLVKELQK